MIAPVVGALLFALLTPFVLYPIILWIRAVLCDHSAPIDWQRLPSVDLVICAHNEANSIGSKLSNALALDYPADLLQIWVASDGSSDGTVQVVREYAEQGVKCLDLPRSGKAAALNQAVAAGKADIVAFSDANSMWEPGALRALIRPMADAEVGGVAGDQRYSGTAHSFESSGERSYWSFDRQLKRWQSRSGNVISATGAIYAVRRALFEPVPADATDDFMVSTGVIMRGFRLAFASDAVAVEPLATRIGEFRRKVRITTRGLRAVFYRRALLWPGSTGFYAFELFVHKLWRRLTWIPLVLLVILAPQYAGSGWFEEIVAGAVIIGTLAGLLGLIVPRLQRLWLINVAAYIVMVNAACAVASFNLSRGRRVSLWETDRATDETLGRDS